MSHLILRNKYKLMGKRAAKAPTLIELVKRISLKETNLKPEGIEEEIEEDSENERLLAQEEANADLMLTS